MDSQRLSQNRCLGVVLRCLLAAALGLAGAGCAPGPAPSGQPAVDVVNDPLEPVNRGIFAFNNAVDKAVIRPVSLAYRDYTPDVFQDRVRDFLRNLRTPIIFANSLLQGNWDGAGTAAGRFFINSTIGIGGLIDIANYNDKGYPYNIEDFGQTLAVWGMGDGPYIVLPLLGPYNARDTLGFAVDVLADPIRIGVNAGNLNEFTYSRTGANVIDQRAPTIDATDELERSSVDYYATIRSIYQRTRALAISNGQLEEDIDIPDIPDYRPTVTETPSTDPPVGSIAPATGPVGMLPLQLDPNPVTEQ